MKRRHFLIAGGIFGAGAYIHQRGLRYPRLGFEPANPVSRFNTDHSQLDLDDFVLTSQTGESLILRAIAPEPSLVFTPQKSSNTTQTITANNIAPAAQLKVEAAANVGVHESVNGIHRTIELTFKPGLPITLNWFLPESTPIKFAAIGDTGGGSELDWCLTRCTQLGVDFLLHLGDFNYGDGEYDRAVEQFSNAKMPVYISIGNHDFNDSGLIYQQFLDQLGPMNNSFIIAGTRFINLDTAVNFFPPYSGNRGHFLQQLVDQTQTVNDTVVFTHKPFIDSREGYTHDISGVGEKPWLYDMLMQLGARDVLCGHVHHNSETDYQGLRQWISGEGLGHEDLVHQKLVSKILLGTINPTRNVDYQWYDLNMPWQMHQSHTHATKLRNYQHFEQLEWYEKLLNSIHSDYT